MVAVRGRAATGPEGADYFVSVIGPAFEVFTRYTRVVNLPGEEIEIPDLRVLSRQAVPSWLNLAISWGDGRAA
jgi:putative DNA methylase